MLQPPAYVNQQGTVAAAVQSLLCLPCSGPTLWRESYYLIWEAFLIHTQYLHAVNCALLHVPVQENMKHKRHLEQAKQRARMADAPAAAVLVGKISSLLTAYAITCP